MRIEYPWLVFDVNIYLISTAIVATSTIFRCKIEMTRAIIRCPASFSFQFRSLSSQGSGRTLHLSNRGSDFLGEVAGGVMLTTFLALEGRFHLTTNLLRHRATRMKATSRRNVRSE